MVLLTRILCSVVLCALVTVELARSAGWRSAYYARVETFTGGDQALHFILASLVFLIMYLLSPRSLRRIWRGGIILAGLVSSLAITELTHYWLPTRRFELADFTCGVAGAFTGWLVTTLVIRLRRTYRRFNGER